jgi:hypothetical protein
MWFTWTVLFIETRDRRPEVDLEHRPTVPAWRLYYFMTPFVFLAQQREQLTVSFFWGLGASQE